MRPERRWLVLGRDGRHAWLGRHSDPTEAELSDLEATLTARGERAFLAVSEGDYWTADRPLGLLLVRPLAGALEADWGAAVSAFEAARAQKLRSPS